MRTSAMVAVGGLLAIGCASGEAPRGREASGGAGGEAAETPDAAPPMRDVGPKPAADAIAPADGLGDVAPDAATAADTATATDAADDAIAARDGAAREAGPASSPLAGIGKVELVRSGFVFVEGLRWVPGLGALLVSDAYGETIYRHTLPDQFTPFRPMSNGANCLDLDPQGRIVTAEVGAMKEKQRGGVSRRLDDGRWVDAIADYRGLALGHPNDVVALPDGNIFFTDLGPHRLFRIDPAGALSLPITTGEDAKMNGLGLSPDKKQLYAGAGGMLRIYDVQAGQLKFARTIPASTDGMCVDQEGNIYASTGQGIRVWDPATGKDWGLIGLPGLTGIDRGTECAFADVDGRTLYMSAVTKLFRVRLAHPGVY